MEAPLPKSPSSTRTPEAINCKFDYEPSIRLYNLLIEVEQGAQLPDEWQKLISNLAREELTLNAQEKELLEMLLKNTLNPSDANSTISVGAYLEKRRVTVKYLANPIKWWNVPAQNLNYVDRFQAEINLAERIKNHFFEKQTYLVLIALHGLGGIGKTQLALAYIWKYRQEYQGIYWFRSDTREQLINDYILFGQELKLYGKEDKQLTNEDKARRVKVWFENKKYKKWLIILDNPENHGAIKDLLPSQGGHILLTSRHTEWPGNCLAINVFSEAESHEFARKIIGAEKIEKEQEELKQLITILGSLPLALAQAYAYISKNEISIKVYLELYAEIRNELMSENLLPTGDEHEVVTITWNITLKKMKEECPESVELLYGCTHFYHQAIPVVLVEVLFKDPQSTTNTALQRHKTLKAKRIAKEYSMINVDEFNKSIDMHILVQQTIKDQLTKKQQAGKYLERSQQMLLQAYPYGNDQMRDYALKRELMPHLEAILKHLDKRFKELLILLKENRQSSVDVEKDVFLDILIFLADAYGDLGRANEKKALLGRVLEIQEKHYGKEHLEVGMTLNNLANAYGESGDIKEQKALLERSLRIKEMHYGKEHVNVAITLNNLANAYGDLGDFKEQRALLERALKIQEVQYGREHVITANTLNNLATTYSDLGHTQAAKELLERALVIQEAYFGKEHVIVANTLNNLANTFSDIGDAKEAKALFERALKILEAHYGKEHVIVANKLNNLANAYGDLGDVKKQRALLERALKIQEAHYGKGHVELAFTLNNLAIACGDLGDAKEKKALLERALELIEAHYGKRHIEIVKILNNLANACGDLGDGEQKKALLEYALVIKESHYGKDHYEVALTLSNLANAYGALGNIEEKKALLERALKIQETYYGTEHVEVAKTSVNLASAYGALNNIEEKKALLERALKIIETYYGIEHAEVAITLLNLGIAYLQQSNFLEARDFVQKAYDIFVKSSNCGVNHPYTIKAINILKKLKYQQLKSYARNQSDNYHAWLKLADCCYQLSNLAEAFDCYSIVTRLSPENSYAHHQLAKLYHQGGDITLAENQFKLALKYQSSSLIYCDYGLLLFRNRNFKKAMRVFFQVMACSDNEEELVYDVREACLLESYLQQLILQHGFIKIPAILFSFYGLIDCYKELNIKDSRLTNALEALCSFVRVEPKPLYYRMLSNTFKKLENNVQAESYEVQAMLLEAEIKAQISYLKEPIEPSALISIELRTLVEPTQERPVPDAEPIAKMDIKLMHVFEENGPTFKFSTAPKQAEAKELAKDTLQNSSVPRP